ncbi:MAG: FAD synthetase family protein [Treponema sp.]|jgi:riboflavin kinase/FMN adenylyltransferase|nr:FAD synthetase family protein [Treponema sp.]
MRIIDWEEYISSFSTSVPLAVTIGVFDGVHKGHQALIQRIGDSPHIPAVVTFRQNPLKTLKPDAFTGDIINLEQKLSFLEAWGVQLTILIDFSPEFSKISGRDFIDLLLDCQPVKLIALGRNFRCGHQLDTGAEEIRSLAGARGLEVWVAPPVMDEGQPVSSSRIRQALAAGRQAEAERLLGWPLDSINPDNIVPNRR